MQALVEDLAEERVRMLTWDERHWPKRKYPIDTANNLAGGRLLLYDPGGQLADGAAEAESGEFINLENEPPWDTWVCFIDNRARSGEEKEKQWKPFYYYLVSWVPPDFIKLANAGIRVNPERCILWATKLDTPFTRQLREAGLVG